MNNKNLFDFFGDFILEDVIENKINNNEFKKYCITIYDHWLNEFEAQEFILSYCEILDGDYKLDEYIEYENKYFSFFNRIFQSSEIFTFDYDYDLTKEVNLIKSKKKLGEILQDCLREKRFYNFVIPELEVIILGNYDLSLPVFMKALNVRIQEMIKEAGLYLLK
ncbi:MAG: hypothetical protein GY830_00970 [Bacteroidetes bacterium]|nr:hypothetical protein [Bacteroidota bacterium]